MLFASLIGTAIEFFDFYIYATAAVLVFPKLFFPASDPATATLSSLATFGIAFLARPIGSALFGHFGDRVGRKATLVAALLTMGVSTVLIGLLPTYGTIGIAAPVLLSLCRSVRVSVSAVSGAERCFSRRRTRRRESARGTGMFPQLGAPIGFLFSGGVFVLLSRWLSDEQFFTFGWRIPFLASAVLVAVGLYVRLTIGETPVFREAINRRQRVKVPMLTVLREHPATLAGGRSRVAHNIRHFLSDDGVCPRMGYSCTGLYTRAVFAHSALRNPLLRANDSVVRYARRAGETAYVDERSRSHFRFRLGHAPLFEAGLAGAILAMAIGMSLVGLAYGPLGTVLAELFPTAVRYTGSSLTFNLAGIFGASLAPYAATWLATTYGLPAVGYYLSGSTLLTLIGLALARETKDTSL